MGSEHHLLAGLRGSEITAIATARDGTLYVGIANHVVAVNKSGQLRWRYDLGQDDEIESILVGGSGTVYDLGWDTFSPGSAGFIDALTPDGERVWWDTVTDGFQEGMLGNDGSVYAHTESTLYHYRG